MSKIKQLFNQWKELQPLKAEDKKRLDDKFNLEFNYNSNHIEGNTLTYGQTKLLLVFGEATGDAKMRDLEEMKAHNVGLKWIRERAKDKEFILTERDIRDLNHIILAEDYYKLNTQTGTRYKINVGIYKTRPNSVITATGETFEYASPEETPALMYELIKWFNEEIEKNELSAVELASLLHYRYIRIHPFEDGNGRIARLLVTYVLERFGCPMVIIKSDNKEEYLRILHQCDINTGLTPSDGANASLEDITPFVEYMKRQLEWSLDICIKAAKGENIEESGDTAKKIAVLKSSLADKVIQKSSNAVRNTSENIFYNIASRVAINLDGIKDMFDSYYITNDVPQKIEPKPSLLKLFSNEQEEVKYTSPQQYENIERLKTHNRYNKKIDYFNLKRQDVFMWFNGFRHDENNTFNLRLSLSIKFESNQYQIYTSISDDVFCRGYDTPITDEETNEFVNQICNSVLSYIESKITQK